MLGILGFAQTTSASCTVDLWVCASWIDDIASDVESNCDGELHGVLHIISDC